MTVVANSILLTRRITELHRRRQTLLEKQTRLRRNLPEWTFAPLQLVGMSTDEIKGMIGDLNSAERDAGLDDIERDLESVDEQIEELENMLLTTPSTSLEAIQAVLQLAISRFRNQTVSDPEDVFYDYGDARVLFLLERAADDLNGLLSTDQRAAG